VNLLPAEGNLLKIYVQGEVATVAYCRRASDAAFEAEDYLLSLSESDRKKFAVRFERLANVGRIINEEQFRYEGDGIYFIKINGHRLACFKFEATWFLLTSGHRKDSKDKGRQRQVRHAQRIRNEFLDSIDKEKQS
jgi:phage-related protein